MTVKRLISSRVTFLWKVLFPLVWSGGFAIGTLALFLTPALALKTPAGVSLTWMQWQFLIMWALFSLFDFWLCMPLKRVFIDATSLYISNYLTEAVIPLSNIANVRENRWCHIGGKNPIIVTFYTPTVMGRHIVFIPTGKAPFSWPWKRKPHPVAAELQAIIEKNR